MHGGRLRCRHQRPALPPDAAATYRSCPLDAPALQTLLAERLYDRLNLWVYPIVLGKGKKVFGDGAVPSNLTLLEPAVTSPKGAVILHYELAEGVPATGTFEEEPPAE